jgi:hypothetical protein
MGIGNDLVTVIKDGRDVYRAAKKIKKDLDDEAKVAKAHLDAIVGYADRLEEIVDDLPDDLTKAQRRQVIASTRALIEERQKHQDAVMDFEERLKLQAQLFTLENQALKLDLLDQFNVRELLENTAPRRKLLTEVRAVQEEIKKQIKAAGAVRVGSKLAILAIDLGVLVAKAAG